MNSRMLKPSPRYLSKLYLSLCLVALAIAIGSVLLAWLIAIDEGPRAGRTVATVFLSLNAAWWLVGMLLAGPYYRSLRYEILDDEVIVHVGIWIKSVKHVPFRTVTNIATKRDIFDRGLFNIGTLNIQTAGMSGKKGAEESLLGLPDVQDVYTTVVGKLRRFRGGMSPTTTEVEQSPKGDETRVLNAILSELRAIRQGLSK